MKTIEELEKWMRINRDWLPLWGDSWNLMNHALIRVRKLRKEVQNKIDKKQNFIDNYNWKKAVLTHDYDEAQHDIDLLEDIIYSRRRCGRCLFTKWDYDTSRLLCTKDKVIPHLDGIEVTEFQTEDCWVDEDREAVSGEELCIYCTASTIDRLDDDHFPIINCWREKGDHTLNVSGCTVHCKHFILDETNE